MSYQNVGPHNLLSLVLMLAVLIATLHAAPRVSFAGIAGDKNGPMFSLFSYQDGSGEVAAPQETGGREPQNVAGEQKAEEQTEDIQQAAARRAQQNADMLAQGKSAPALPATPENLNRIADPTLVPEGERRAYEYKDDENIQRAQEEQATRDNREQATLEQQGGAPTSEPQEPTFT